MSGFYDLDHIACKCGCGLRFEERFAADLSKAFHLFHFTFGLDPVITSGPRCPTYNIDVHGAPNSPHLLGRGVDLWFPAGRSAIEVISIFTLFGFHRFGLPCDRSWIHVDSMSVADGYDCPAVWYYPA